MSVFSFKQMMWVSIIASVFASIADIMILYSPNGGYHLMDYRYLKDVPYNRLLIGHYLGLVTIPLYLLGLWWVTKALKPAGEKVPDRAFFFLSFLLILGVLYHGLVAMIWLLIDSVEDPTALIKKGRVFFEPISSFIIILVIIASAVFSRWVLQGKSLFPKWIIWCIPVFSFIIFILLYIFVPIIGNYLIVSGFNLSVGIFLFAAWIALKDKHHLLIQ